MVTPVDDGRPTRCSQRTVEGLPCQSYPVEGSDRCASHLRLNGPKSTLTPAIVETIARLVSAGNHTNVACLAAGVPRATFYNWWRRGDPKGDEDEDAGFRQFRERIEHARAEGEAVLVTRIAADARTNVSSAIWLLERTAPQRWARVSQRDAAEAASEEKNLDEMHDPFLESDDLAEARRRRLAG